MGYSDETPRATVERTLQLVDMDASTLHVVAKRVTSGASYTDLTAVGGRLPAECLALFTDGHSRDVDDLTAEEREWIVAEADELSGVVA